MDANSRSRVAILDVPFSDPFVDDGRADDDVPIYDQFGHAHFTGTSKGFRSALVIGKRVIETPIGLKVGGWINVDACGELSGGMDLIVRGSGRCSEWYFDAGYVGRGLTADGVYMRITFQDLAFNCREVGPMVEFKKVNRCSLDRVFAYNAPASNPAGVILGPTENQCVYVSRSEFGTAALHSLATSQFSSRDCMYERPRGGADSPGLYVTAVTRPNSISGPIVSDNDHFERDDMGLAFLIEGADVVRMMGAELTYSVGRFKDCSHVIDEPNYFKYGSRFEYPGCTKVQSQSGRLWGLRGREPMSSYVDPKNP